MTMLNTETTKFERSGSGLLSVSISDADPIMPIHCVRLFPLSDPEHYISIVRTEKSDEPEIGILRDINDLPAPQRELILDELKQRHFLPEVLDVIAIRMSNGMDEWDVLTDRGEKRFFVGNRKESIAVTDDNMLIITDVDKCRYRVADYTALSSQAVSLVGRALP